MTTPPAQRTSTLLLALGAVALLLQTATPCHAASGDSSRQASNKSTQPKAKSRAVKIKHQQNHSGESTAERDRRLYRECQGLPNAGACRGYTRR